MKDKIRIKSFSNGLTIQLAEQCPFEELLNEVGVKFREGKSFFGNAAVAIAFRGRELSPDEEEQLLEAIESNCNLKIICMVSKDEEQDKLFGKALQHFERKKLAESDIGKEIQVFQGALKDGEDLETPNSIIILGDVCSGGSVSSEKNILVLGGLYGKAHAGRDSHSGNCCVAALEMTPDELFIGDFKYIPVKKAKWGKKKKTSFLVARVQENSIVMEELTKESLLDF